jgi:prepilin-type N-terminal cleavage/methylation domain-containing protein
MGENTVDRPVTSQSIAPDREDGFSLIEVLVSMVVLAIGLISLAGVLALSIQRVASSTPALIAREKAREAVESVHTARDTGLISWAGINNTNNGGRFVEGDQPIRLPGPDGLVNTTDDPSTVETLRRPGNDGILGNGDDVLIPLNDYTRRVTITPLPQNNGQGVNPNLRQIVVTVRYRVNNQWLTYNLTTYISNFS